MSGRLGAAGPDSRSTSPRRSSASSVPGSADRRSRTPGARSRTAVIRALPQAAVRVSCQRTVNTLSSEASSSSRCADSSCWACCTRVWTWARMASARVVGTMLRPVRTRIWSPVALRIRPRERLIAGAVTCRRAAAPATLPSSNRASRAVRRFRSSCMGVTLQVHRMHFLLLVEGPAFEVRDHHRHPGRRPRRHRSRPGPTERRSAGGRPVPVGPAAAGQPFTARIPSSS